MGHKNWATHLGRSLSAGCDHRKTVSTVTAGLQRDVCETCGHVSIRYAGDGAFWPETPGVEMPVVAPAVRERAQDRALKDPACCRCGARAIFMTPIGLACNEHAWSAASKQESFSSDFWIPRLLNRPGSRRLMDDLGSGEGTSIDLTTPDPDDR